MILEDFSEAVKSKLYERVSAPLSGTFLLSWILWNWKFVIGLIFGSDKYLDRISYLSGAQLMPGWYLGLILPFLSTAFLIFIYPIPARFVLKFSEKQNQESRKIKQDYDDQKRLSQQQSILVKQEANTKVREMSEQVERLEAEIRDLKSPDETKPEANEEVARLKRIMQDRDSVVEKMQRDIAEFTKKTAQTPNIFEAPSPVSDGKIPRTPDIVLDIAEEMLGEHKKGPKSNVGMKVKVVPFILRSRVDTPLDNVKVKLLWGWAGPHVGMDNIDYSELFLDANQIHSKISFEVIPDNYKTMIVLCVDVKYKKGVEIFEFAQRFFREKDNSWIPKGHIPFMENRESKMKKGVLSTNIPGFEILAV